jgi:ubiquinone/menaquinone biosynthesis C-methylase UbiE
VANLALVAGSNHGNAISEVPSHVYLNSRPLAPAEVFSLVTQAHCGLILSAVEGACYASSEYLLCGIPVVSTVSDGGRDEWYDDYNSIISDANPESVAAAVAEFVRRQVSPVEVRSRHIAKANDFRERFVTVLRETFSRFGVVGIDAKEYFAANFFHKMRTSIRPDFNSIFARVSSTNVASTMAQDLQVQGVESTPAHPSAPRPTDEGSSVSSVGVSAQLAEGYSRQYSDAVVPWRDVGALYKARHILELCQRASLVPSRLLEVGAGEGGILKHLHQASFCDEMYAIEISATGVDYIRRRSIPTLKEAKVFDGYRIPYPDDCFDLAVLSHVLEHVEHERVLLRELKRVSRHQVVEVPLDFSWNVDKKLEHFLSYGHINIYTAPQLRFLLLSEGFEILCDTCNINGPEVTKYQHFVINKNERTESAVLEIERKIEADLHAFSSLTLLQREQRARDYTVLCRKSASSLKIF